MKRLLPCLFLLSASLQAATLYVDKDNSCPGDGSTGNPYCTIQRAFDVANADDHIKIRDSATAYSEAPSLTRAGTSGHSIIVEPDTANNPNIAAAGSYSFNIRASYVTVQNLKFDASGINSKFAIRVEPNGSTITGITITGCTIKNQGGTESDANDTGNEGGILVRNTFGTAATVTFLTLSNNTFDGNRGYIGALLSGANNLTITGNEVKNGHRGVASDGSPIEVGFKLASDSSAPSPSNDANTFTIDSNTIHDFDPVSTATLNAVGKFFNIIGIYGDVGARNATVTNNLIYKLAETTTSNSQCNSNTKCQGANPYGVNPESRCHNWIIRQNRIYRVGKNGVYIGSGSSPTTVSHVADNTQVVNNTIFSVGNYGIVLAGGANESIKNNIVKSAGSAQIRILSTTERDSPYGPHYFDYNEYNGTTTADIAGTTYTFTNWKTQLSNSSQTATDAHSITTDPLFTSTTVDAENFTLQAGSPAIATGAAGVNIGWDMTTTGGGSPAGAISQVTPLGNSRWIIGESRQFVWTNTGTVGNVDILESFDSGATFPVTIASNIANTGSFNWTVLGPVNRVARFKVQDHGTPTISDTSDADINIGGNRGIFSQQ